MCWLQCQRHTYARHRQRARCWTIEEGTACPLVVLDYLGRTAHCSWLGGNHCEGARGSGPVCRCCLLIRSSLISAPLLSSRLHLQTVIDDLLSSLSREKISHTLGTCKAPLHMRVAGSKHYYNDLADLIFWSQNNKKARGTSSTLSMLFPIDPTAQSDHCNMLNPCGLPLRLCCTRLGFQYDFAAKTTNRVFDEIRHELTLIVGGQASSAAVTLKVCPLHPT